MIYIPRRKPKLFSQDFYEIPYIFHGPIEDCDAVSSDSCDEHGQKRMRLE